MVQCNPKHCSHSNKKFKLIATSIYFQINAIGATAFEMLENSLHDRK